MQDSIDVTGANSCTGGLGNQLAMLTNFSGQSNAAQSFGAAGVVSPVLTQTPKPTSLLLMGTGMVGVGMFFRRRMRA